jgi:hypothetical protein
MEATGRRRSILFLLPLLGFLQGGAAAAPETEAPLEGLDFTLSVVSEVRPESQRVEPHAWEDRAGSNYAMARPGPDVRLDKSVLKTDTVTVQAGTRVENLLRSRAIVPDGDALSAIYLLNPEVRNVNDLKAGTRLVVPALAPGKVAAGARVQLVLIPGTKRDIEQLTGVLDGLVPQLAQLPAERVGTPAERQEVSKALEDVQGYLKQVNTFVTEGDMPLSPEMLGQFLDGARLVREVLDKALRPDGRWTGEDRQAIARIAEDMKLKAMNFDELRNPAGPAAMRWRDVRVVVSVVQVPGQKPVSDLRVFYAPEALVSKPFAVRSFPGLSPQVAKRLLEADYVFWGAPPGSSSQPVTDQVREEIRRRHGDEIRIQVTVQSPAQEKR